MPISDEVCEDCNRIYYECDCCKNCRNIKKYCNCPTPSPPPPPLTKEQIKEREKLREEMEEKEKKREKEFELRFKQLLDLLILMYPDAKREDLQEFFKIVGNIKYLYLEIPQKVINFLEEHKSSIKDLSLNQTCYLVLLFSDSLKHIEIKDLKVPGHVVSKHEYGHPEYDSGYLTGNDFSVIFDFLVEVNSQTFVEKKISDPSNWRVTSMKYLYLLQRLLYFFEDKKLYKLLKKMLIKGSEAFSRLEKREKKKNTSDIWKAVIVPNDKFFYHYGTRSVYTTKFRNFTKWRGIWLPYKSVIEKSDA